MSSITYRIATGRDAGCKVVTLQTLPGDAGSLEGEAGKVGGFSLHAGVAAEAHESHKLEKLCRYITRPAISEKRLSIALQGQGYCENHYIHSFELENGRIKRNREFMNPIQKLRALGIAVPQIKRDGIPT